MATYGVTHLHHFFLPRPRFALFPLGDMQTMSLIAAFAPALLFAFEQAIMGHVIARSIRADTFLPGEPVPIGCILHSALRLPRSRLGISLTAKSDALSTAFAGLNNAPRNTVIGTQSATRVSLVPNSVTTSSPTHRSARTSTTLI